MSNSPEPPLSRRQALRRKRSLAEQRYQKHRQRNRLAQPGVHSVALVLDNLKAGFNVAKIFRSAHAFGAAEVHLVNIGPFDPAPAKGGFKHVPARFHDDFANCHAELTARGYRIFTLTPHTDQLLWSTALPKRSAFVLGHEEFGLSFDPADYPGIGRLAIPHCGPVESLNVAVAASIVLYEYARQHNPE
jgi:tRNA G18 (ribose-2'-O)-methylase SpoU